MKSLFLICVWVELIPLDLPAQGFVCYNETALTRIGSLNGPLAGPAIYAQCFAGITVDSLAPVGVAVPHSAADPGYLSRGEFVAVPGAGIGGSAYVQLVAWDSRQWGIDLAGVPPAWLGRTDVVSVFLTSITGNPQEPLWRQPAIVPIPEPTIMALAILGSFSLVLLSRIYRR